MLTLSEIAKKYKRTPKTFKKHVEKCGIPYEMLGRSMMFDPVAVSNHLAALSRRVEPKNNTVRFTRRKASSRFADAVGI